MPLEHAHRPGRFAPGELAYSGLIFTRDDLQQTGQEQAAPGVRCPAPPARLPCGWWPVFGDPGGTGRALGRQDRG